MVATSAFSKWASQYDRSRRQLIPCFDEFYSAALKTLSFAESEPIEVLDLGAGTGLFSAFILEAFPNAKLTLVDASNEMLEIARNRFQLCPGQFKYVVADYSRELPKGQFDAVVSALSIHHLEEADKLHLWKEVFKALLPGGIFVNADQVLGNTAEEEWTFRELWLHEVKERGVSNEDLGAAFERMQEDKMSTLEVQLVGLKSAGFKQVECVFQNKSFVVFTGYKSRENI